MQGRFYFLHADLAANEKSAWGAKDAKVNLVCKPFDLILQEIGWGGRIRTFTILINSEVSYQLDHAPAGVAHANWRKLREKTGAKYLLRIPRRIARPNRENLAGT